MRYTLGIWLQKIEGLSFFPFSTLAVNVIGSFLIGILLLPSIFQGEDSSHYIRIFAVVGVLGGFTTFSAYSGEVMYYITQQAYVKAMLIFALNNFLSIIAAFAGFFIAKQIMG